MSGWYWRDGTLALPFGVPLDDPAWLDTMRAIREKLTDMDYKVVAQETLDTGYWVSTVWLGLDHNFLRGGPPLIFETMVFMDRGECRETVDCERYSTEDEARHGHEVMKLKYGYAGLGLNVCPQCLRTQHVESNGVCWNCNDDSVHRRSKNPKWPEEEK